MKTEGLTDLDLDILGEIGNIGSGNAATALSQMLDQPIWLEVPTVKKCNLLNIAHHLGGAEHVQTCVFLTINEALNGYIMLLLDDEDVQRISDIVAGGYEGIDPNSVIMEVGNIITGAYVCALASMLNGKLNLSPPELAHDMVGSLIDGVVSALLHVADEIVIVSTKLTIKAQTISCNYILFLEDESLKSLLDYFKKAYGTC